MWVLDHKKGWELNQCFWIVVLEKSLEIPLDYKKIKPISPKGNQPWIFTGRTDAKAEAPTLWPPDAKSQLTAKDPDARKDWRQKEKGPAEDEMVGWHHWLSGHEFEQIPGDWRRDKSGMLQSAGSQRVRHNWVTEQQHKSVKNNMIPPYPTLNVRL